MILVYNKSGETKYSCLPDADKPAQFQALTGRDLFLPHTGGSLHFHIEEKRRRSKK